MVKYQSNPFIETLFIKEATKLTKVANTTYKLTNSFGKKVKGDIVYANEHNIDRTQFLKLFNTTFLLHLSKAGVIIFNYICTHCIRYNTDYIIIFIEDAISRTEYNSPKSIHKGVNELITANVIAKSSKAGIYWLNPSIVYKGERRFLKLK